jgi:hypothetical protein
MESNGTSNDRPPASTTEQITAIEAAIRELAYRAWADYRRNLEQDTSRRLFERVYLGTLDGYVSQLVDAYQLDAKLDQCIAEPFRRHVDIDVPAFGQALVSSEAIYALLAVPVGVWVFNGEIG